MTKSIEGKLPESLKKEWLVYVADPQNDVIPNQRFDRLLTFLKQQEKIYEELEQLKGEEPNRKESRFEQRHARTKTIRLAGDEGCVVCGDVKHRRKLYFCRKFKAQDLTDKKAAVKRLGACMRCLEVHEDQSPCKPGFLCRNQDCRDEHAPQHHFCLCPKSVLKKPDGRPDREKGKQKYTQVQEDFISNLPSDLARRCREVFSNVASRAFSASNDDRSLLEKDGVPEFPVIMMLLFVTANAGQKVGTLIDLASDTNYITHKAAK